MDNKRWVYPYDNKGERCHFKDLPKSIKDLKDDPYRSLAGLVRNGGGYAKDQTPFSEFLWADFFRPRIAASRISKQQSQAVRAAIKLAHSREARYLPGWICQKRGKA